MCRCWRTYSFRGVHCSPASTSVWKVRVPWSEHFVVPVRLSRQFWISDKSYKSVIKLEKSVSDVLVAFISSISRCFDGIYFFDSRYSRSLRRRSFSIKRISFECTEFPNRWLFLKSFPVLNTEQQLALAILGFEGQNGGISIADWIRQVLDQFSFPSAFTWCSSLTTIISRNQLDTDNYWYVYSYGEMEWY